MLKQHQFPISLIQVLLFSKSLYKFGLIWLLVCGLFINAATLPVSTKYIGSATTSEVPEPVQIVESQTNLLMDVLSSRKQEFDNDPKSLIYFARHKALSHWNLRKTSRLMLGSYWKNATSEQQERFEEEFLRTLLRYVVKAYGFYDESLVEIISYDWQPKGKGGWVRSVIRLPAGLKVSVDYRMDRNKLKQWKMIDVRVEGISLVSHKRGEYREMINQHGLEALLKTMFEKNYQVLGT